MKGMRVTSLILFLLGFMLLGSFPLQAQHVYLVTFKDKPEITQWNCREWLTERAIERRIKHGLPCHDHLDLPLNSDYVCQVREIADSFRYELRWFNAVSVKADFLQRDAIARLPFVQNVEAIDGVELNAASVGKKEPDSTKMKFLEGLRVLARGQLGLDSLKNSGYTGKGVRIAIFDAGFKGAEDHEAFQHIRDANKILKTWDFQGNREDVYGFSGHGTAVLSCIAGKMNGEWIGAAPEAEFLLARTEATWSEKMSEEDHWVAAAEWAERNGADIISSSLGYTRKYDWQTDLTGEKTIVSRGAAMAIRKGILVVNSLGNEGQKKFKYLGSPADTDSVLSVGATYPMLPYIMPFSSYGPNGRGVMKPDICAPGYMTTAGKKGNYKVAAGTSFSCPLVSGYAAALMQANPQATNMQIRDQVRQSGHLYPYYDYRYGYGVPHEFVAELPDSIPCNLEYALRNDSLIFKFPPPRMLPTDSTNEAGSRVLHIHQEISPGKLLDYQADLIRKNAKGGILPFRKQEGTTLRIWFDGCLYEEE